MVAMQEAKVSKIENFPSFFVPFTALSQEIYIPESPKMYTCSLWKLQSYCIKTYDMQYFISAIIYHIMNNSTMLGDRTISYLNTLYLNVTVEINIQLFVSFY